MNAKEIIKEMEKLKNEKEIIQIAFGRVQFVILCFNDKKAQNEYRKLCSIKKVNKKHIEDFFTSIDKRYSETFLDCLKKRC